MAKLTWDEVGTHLYETGVNNCVLYPLSATATDKTKGKQLYPKGVAWNGISSVSENPSGGDPNEVWADNIKYLSLLSAEDFGASVEAYTYPEEFAICDGTAELVPGVLVGQQTRQAFGLCYKTRIGSDSKDDLGYKLHLVYNAKASPSEKSYQTINDSPEATPFSWEITTTPVPVTGHNPTAILTIDSTKVDKAKLMVVEEALYGTDSDSAYLPLPDEIFAMLTAE